MALDLFPYDVTDALGGGHIVTCRGNEVGVAGSLRDAAALVASDAVAAWPEAASDFLSEFASETGFALSASDVGSQAFLDCLTVAVEDSWSQAAAPRP